MQTVQRLLQAVRPQFLKGAPEVHVKGSKFNPHQTGSLDTCMSLNQQLHGPMLLWREWPDGRRLPSRLLLQALAQQGHRRLGKRALPAQQLPQRVNQFAA